MVRACARTRSPAHAPKRPAARCLGSTHWQWRAPAPRRGPVPRAAPCGFRPCRGRYTKAPVPVLSCRPPPISPDWTLNRAPAIPAAARKSTPAKMTESTLPDYAIAAPADPLTRRRIFFTLIVLASMAGLIWLLAFALTAGGFSALDFILV